LPVIAFMMLAFRNTNSTVISAESNMQEQSFILNELSYNISDAKINVLVKNAGNNSLLQVGKPFNISIIKNERDRLKTLLEKNGYDNISNNAISFLIDSSSVNNRFAVQVNIDLTRKKTIANNSGERTENNKLIQSTKNDRAFVSSVNKQQAPERI